MEWSPAGREDVRPGDFDTHGNERPVAVHEGLASTFTVLDFEVTQLGLNGAHMASAQGAAESSDSDNKEHSVEITLAD
jgi:hypothetical protein